MGSWKKVRKCFLFYLKEKMYFKQCSYFIGQTNNVIIYFICDSNTIIKHTQNYIKCYLTRKTRDLLKMIFV